MDPHENYIQKEMQTSKQAGDWILDLFAPSFATAADVLEGRKDCEVKESKIRYVSAFDPESLTKVYERVHMMLKMDEELKSQTMLSNSNTQPEISNSHMVDVQSADKKVNLRDSEIWNSEELSVLRNVFRAAKVQICELEVKLRQSQQHTTELEEKYATQTQTLEVKAAKLSEATKANHRLKIYCDELQTQLKASGMKLDAVTEMWKEIDQEKMRMMKELQTIRLSLDRERMAREKLEIELQETDQEITREKMLAEENAKTRYEHKILKLEEELRKCQCELKNERQVHGLSKKALEHLRNHFASLPLREVMPPGIVDQDQISVIDHLEGPE